MFFQLADSFFTLLLNRNSYTPSSTIFSLTMRPFCVLRLPFQPRDFKEGSYFFEEFKVLPFTFRTITRLDRSTVRGVDMAVQFPYKLAPGQAVVPSPLVISVACQDSLCLWAPSGLSPVPWSVCPSVPVPASSCLGSMVLLSARVGHPCLVLVSCPLLTFVFVCKFKTNLLCFVEIS